MPSSSDEDEKFDVNWENTRFVVEATSFEQFELWRQHSTEGLLRGQRDPDQSALRVTWEQMNPGCLNTIGTLFGRPICVSVSWARVDGQLVAFYDAASELVDYKMVDTWIQEQCSATWANGARRAHCNAMNFHHCLDALAELNKKAVSA